MNKKMIAIIVVAVLVVIGIIFFAFRKGPVDNHQQGPVPVPVLTEDIADIKLGETVTGNTEVSITPLQVIEDSRCPDDVQCVWSGRIIVKAKIAEGDASKEYQFILPQEPKVDTDFGEITLIEANPSQHSKKTINPKDYRFTFGIKR